MNSLELELLANLIAERLPPPIPLSIQLWDGDQVARYLQMDARYVKEKLLVLPTAPAAIRINGKSNPKYKAMQIVAWAEAFQEKRRA